MKFKTIETPIPDLFVIETKMFGDERGFFVESFNKQEFQKLNLECEFVQDNHSKSQKGILRGLHFQTVNPQGKLVRVASGKVFDVAADLRIGSPTYLQHYSIELSETNNLMMFIPIGFAHGFLSLEDDTHFQYKVTDYFHAESDGGILWSDKDINVNWPFKKYDINEPRISEKDRNLPLLKNFENPFKYKA